MPSATTRTQSPVRIPLLVRLICLGALLSLLTACGGQPQVTAPASPDNLSVTPGPGYIELAWEHDGANVQKFHIDRTLTSSGAAQLQPAQSEPYAVVPGSARSYMDHGTEVGAEYDYTVTAVGAGGPSAAAPAGGPAAVESGFTVLVGTYNHLLYPEPVTAFGFYLHFGADAPPADAYVRVTGPAGWSSEANEYITLAENAFASTNFEWSFVPLTPVAGEYLFEIRSDHQTYATTTTTVSGFADLSGPTDVTASLQSDGTVTSTWATADADTVSYVATVYRGDYSDTSRLLASHATQGTAHDFTDLNLLSGPHFAAVMGFNLDRTAPVPPMVERFAVSLGVSALFQGPAVAACVEPAEVVTVLDAGLRAAMREALALPDGDITCQHMRSLEELNAFGRGVTDLEGIQHAVNLTNLNLRENNISRIDLLAGLSNLQILQLAWNDMTDISPVADLTNLIALTVNDTPVSNLDAVAGLMNLVQIELANTQVSSLEPLRDLDLLVRVGAGHINNLTDISPVAGSALVSVYLNGNPNITNLEVLAEFSDMQRMLVGNTGWNDTLMAMVATMPNLTTLQLWGNPDVTNVSAVVGLTDLYELDLGGTSVTDLTPIHDLPGVGLLSLYWLNLEDADFAFLEGLTNLTRLWLDGNFLTDLSMLVNNLNIGEGTEVDVSNNCLDLSTSSATMDQVNALIARGAEVTYEPQRQDCPL